MVMRDVGRLSDLIGAIYDCALDGERWAPTLERIAEAVGACNGTIMRMRRGHPPFIHHWGMPPGALAAYEATYAALNPLRTLPWHCEVDVPVSLDMFMTAEELRATRFYREFIGPLGWFDFIIVPLERTEKEMSLISLTRRDMDGAPHPRDLDIMRLLAPHIRRALVIQGQLSAAEANATDLASTLESLSTPILLFDRDGRCVMTNAAANRILDAMPGLRLVDGRLSTSDPALRLLLSGPDTHQGLPPNVDTGPQTIGIVEPDGRRYSAQLVPLGRAVQGETAGRAVSAMFIQEVGQLKPLPGEVLVRLYGLTPAETRLLVLLAEGHSVEEAAAILGVAISTARTHLNRLHGKTGTHRQQDLVRLVLSALP